MIDENYLIKDFESMEMPAIDIIKEVIERQPKTGEWIPVEERLPEEKVNPVTNDYYAYPVTVNISGTVDVRYYGFGNGHWWNNSPFPADEYVVAWMDRPEPWEVEK